jgi:hypothetical protein
MIHACTSDRRGMYKMDVVLHHYQCVLMFFDTVGLPPHNVFIFILIGYCRRQDPTPDFSARYSSSVNLYNIQCGTIVVLG